MLDSAKEFVTHPWTTATAVFATVATVFQVPFVDAVWSVLWANAGNIFTVLSVSAFTLAPNVPWLPADQLAIGALIAGALFVVTKLDQIIDSLRSRLTEDNT